MDQEFMKKRKILPLVLSMALPMVISMAVNSLYNIVDSYFIAKMSEDALTALALVYPVQNLITAVAVGFGVGINATVAFFLGAKEQKRADAAVTQGMVFSLLHGIILTVVCIGGMPTFLRMFSSDEKIIALALTYSNRAFAFAIAITLGIAIEKIFQAVGRMEVSMICMMAGFIANIILDPLMIFGIGIFPEMGIAGAAYATGIGQCLTLILYLVIYKLSPIPVKFRADVMKPEAAIARRLYLIGIPAALNTALPSLLVSALNGILADFSEKYVLVLGVYYKLQTFIYLTGNGIVQGMRPICGYNYGAGEYKRVKAIFKAGLELISVVMLAGTVLCLLIPDRLIGIFTSNQETVLLGKEALLIICRGFILSGVSVTISGVLEGLGKGVESLLISLIRYLVVLLPLAFLFSRFQGAAGVWQAFWVTELVAAVLSIVLFGRVMEKISKEKR